MHGEKDKLAGYFLQNHVHSSRLRMCLKLCQSKILCNDIREHGFLVFDQEDIPLSIFLPRSLFFLFLHFFYVFIHSMQCDVFCMQSDFLYEVLFPLIVPYLVRSNFQYGCISSPQVVLGGAYM